MKKNWIELSDGKFLLKDFGKYKSDLLIISDKPEIKYQKTYPKEFNLDKGDLTFIRGTFFVTKKGANAFRIEEKGSHLLLRDDWEGGSKYWGFSLFKLDNLLYKRRASSNGGGMGYDYVVVPVGSKQKISIEDL